MDINRLLNQKVFESILVYHAVEWEVDLAKTIDWLVSQDKVVYLPFVKDVKVGLYEKGKLVKKWKKFMEPARSVHVSQIDIALVPGLAFTLDGKRLGRGAGWYDRFFEKVQVDHKIGICTPEQIIDDIPTDVWDVLMDEVIVV